MPERFTYSHPAERIRHTVENAIARLRAVANNPAVPDAVRFEADKLVLALFDVPSDADAMQLALQRKDDELRGVLESNYRMAREITELTRQGDHNEDASASAPIQIPVTREPRSASGGA